jgi:hypothetical protein
MHKSRECCRRGLSTPDCPCGDRGSRFADAGSRNQTCFRTDLPSRTSKGLSRGVLKGILRGVLTQVPPGRLQRELRPVLSGDPTVVPTRGPRRVPPRDPNRVPSKVLQGVPSGVPDPVPSRGPRPVQRRCPTGGPTRVHPAVPRGRRRGAPWTRRVILQN